MASAHDLRRIKKAKSSRGVALRYVSKSIEHTRSRATNPVGVVPKPAYKQKVDTRGWLVLKSYICMINPKYACIPERVSSTRVARWIFVGVNHNRIASNLQVPRSPVDANCLFVTENIVCCECECCCVALINFLVDNVQFFAELVLSVSWLVSDYNLVLQASEQMCL
jgi:hypothetical protein